MLNFFFFFLHFAFFVDVYHEERETFVRESG